MYKKISKLICLKTDTIGYQFNVNNRCRAQIALLFY